MYVFHSIGATKESGRLGRLVNHSKKYPNAVVKLIEVDGVPRLYLFANQNIPKGAEILYDYGERRKIQLQEYPWLTQCFCLLFE